MLPFLIIGKQNISKLINLFVKSQASSWIFRGFYIGQCHCLYRVRCRKIGTKIQVHNRGRIHENLPVSMSSKIIFVDYLVGYSLGRRGRRGNVIISDCTDLSFTSIQSTRAICGVADGISIY